MRKTWENMGISTENRAFTGFTQENVDFKPEKMAGLARFDHSDGSFNHQHKEFEEEKNSDMSWGYKENLCFWVDHTEIYLDMRLSFQEVTPAPLLNHHFPHQNQTINWGKIKISCFQTHPDSIIHY